AILLPWALYRAAALRLAVPWRRALPVGLVMYAAITAAAVARGWRDNLRFAPWVDISVGVAIGVLTLVLAWRLGPRLPRERGRIALVAAAAFAVFAATLLGVSASEPARKAGVARAGLVAPTLELGRQLLDLDGDGYAGWLGGGDCNDHDPDIHPEA